MKRFWAACPRLRAAGGGAGAGARRPCREGRRSGTGCRLIITRCSPAGRSDTGGSRGLSSVWSIAGGGRSGCGARWRSRPAAAPGGAGSAGRGPGEELAAGRPLGSFPQVGLRRSGRHVRFALTGRTDGLPSCARGATASPLSAAIANCATAATAAGIHTGNRTAPGGPSAHPTLTPPRPSQRCWRSQTAPPPGDGVPRRGVGDQDTGTRRPGTWLSPFPCPTHLISTLLGLPPPHRSL
ncbi:hypothetical protein ABIE67_010284 [Streptomyces sp. V4I8]